MAGWEDVKCCLDYSMNRNWNKSKWYPLLVQLSKMLPLKLQFPHCLTMHCKKTNVCKLDLLWKFRNKIPCNEQWLLSFTSSVLITANILKRFSQTYQNYSQIQLYILNIVLHSQSTKTITSPNSSVDQ